MTRIPPQPGTRPALRPGGTPWSSHSSEDSEARTVESPDMVRAGNLLFAWRREAYPLLALVIGGVALLGLDIGCALLPQFGEPPTVTPPVVAADTTRTQVPDPDLWPTATETPAEPVQTTEPAKPRPKPPITTAPEDSSLARTEPVPADSTVVDVAPAITVSPPRKALEEIETETLASLKEAKRLISSVDTTNLGPEGQDKLRIVRGFVTQAEDALVRQDVQAAAGLARKARLLAVELTSR